MSTIETLQSSLTSMLIAGSEFSGHFARNLEKRSCRLDVMLELFEYCEQLAEKEGLSESWEAISFLRSLAVKGANAALKAPLDGECYFEQFVEKLEKYDKVWDFIEQRDAKADCGKIQDAGVDPDATAMYAVLMPTLGRRL